MRHGQLKHRLAKIMGLAIWGTGTLLLFTNSEIHDLALALVSVGGLMTIWFKLGSLEATTKALEERFSKVEHCVDMLERELHERLWKLESARDKS